jgi:hypothetical protein
MTKHKTSLVIGPLSGSGYCPADPSMIFGSSESDAGVSQMTMIGVSLFLQRKNRGLTLSERDSGVFLTCIRIPMASSHRRNSSSRFVLTRKRSHYRSQTQGSGGHGWICSAIVGPFHHHVDVNSCKQPKKTQIFPWFVTSRLFSRRLSWSPIMASVRTNHYRWREIPTLSERTDSDLERRRFPTIRPQVGLWRELHSNGFP